MYLDFFKFKKNPFHITPDPEFLFLSPSHKEASASILYGIEERKGFVAVFGEVGVGKTTILRSYLEGTDSKRIKIVYLFNAAVSFDRMVKQIASELDIEVADETPSELVDSLFRCLIHEYENDRNVVLIIDEAQNMPVETLERLRMLSNLETSQDKLLQIILVGQPEFEQKLNVPELRQLKQRIAIRCRINALTPDESLAYIQHRLMRASLFHNPVFTKDALNHIVKEANGIPRLINILCDNALITAFGYQRNPVDAKIIKEVIKDFSGGLSERFFNWRVLWAKAAVVFSGLAVGVAVLLLTSGEISHYGTGIGKEVSEFSHPAKPVKKPVDKPSAESVPKVEPEPSIPDGPATGSDRSVSEIMPPGSNQSHGPASSQEGVLEGEVSIFNKDGQNLKVDQVEVLIYNPDSIMDHFSKQRESTAVEISALEQELKRAQLDRDNKEQLYRKINYRNKKSHSSIDRHYLKRLRDEYTRSSNICDNLEAKKYALLSSFRYFSVLPPPLSSGKTNPDGRFSIMLPSEIKFVLIAKARREMGDTIEKYYWLFPVSLEGKTNKFIVLSNDNMLPDRFPEYLRF